MLRSLVGSEMCIRDSNPPESEWDKYAVAREDGTWGFYFFKVPVLHAKCCLLYTSDAADDLLCVDLGGRRTIKKKKTNKHIMNQ